MTRTLNDDTVASDPVGISVSHRLLAMLEPELLDPPLLDRLIPSRIQRRQFWMTRIPEQLMHGDSRAALVVQRQPLLVAAYTDELDCVVQLRFPESFQPPMALEVGTRLLTVNVYADINNGVAPDLTLGERHFRRYGNFTPYIADFLSASTSAIARRIASISEDEWERCSTLADAWRRKSGGRARDGRPTRSFIPA
ncbi:MAG: hypothetical protein AB2A00_10785 [Myxococcota bacterium]